MRPITLCALIDAFGLDTWPAFPLLASRQAGRGRAVS
jgi:hypothetical protein